MGQRVLGKPQSLPIRLDRVCNRFSATDDLLFIHPQAFNPLPPNQRLLEFWKLGLTFTLWKWQKSNRNEIGSSVFRELDQSIKKPKKMNTNHVIACIFGAFTLAVNSCGGDSDSGGSYSESASENAGGERVQGSQELKEEILSGLTREEKALRNYEDEMILKGETKSNPHYEELQRKAQNSR